MTAAVSGVPAEATLAMARKLCRDDHWIERHSDRACERCVQDVERVLAVALPFLREGIAAEVLGPVRALADEWQKYHDDSAPNAYTIIYGDAANLLKRRLPALSAPVQAAEPVDPRPAELAETCVEVDHDCEGSADYGACSGVDETIVCPCACHRRDALARVIQSAKTISAYDIADALIAADYVQAAEGVGGDGD